jgi:hypothetical protein
MKACHLSTGDLAGEDDRAASIAFLDDFVEITTGTGVERFETLIVENEELDVGETSQDTCIAVDTAGERELGEELRDPLIENRAVVTAGLVTERTGKPTLADPSGSAQDQIVVRVDPLAMGELLVQSAVEASRGSVIDILDAGLLAQSGIAQPGSKALVAAMGELAIDQQAQPVGMGEHSGFVGGFELGKGLGHAG